MSDDGYVLNERDIMRVLPHRYPFLLIDRIESYTKGESIHAVKTSP